MSQIDKLNFLPHLFWFFVLFGIFYFIVFSYILPMIFQALETRSIFFYALLEDSFSGNIFFQFFVHFYNGKFFEILIKNFISYLKQLKGIHTLKSTATNKSYYYL